jgi:DNA-binding transcriptional regulator YhcF (GntR family)
MDAIPDRMQSIGEIIAGGNIAPAVAGANNVTQVGGRGQMKNMNDVNRAREELHLRAGLAGQQDNPYVKNADANLEGIDQHTINSGNVKTGGLNIESTVEDLDSKKDARMNAHSILNAEAKKIGLSGMYMSDAQANYFFANQQYTTAKTTVDKQINDLVKNGMSKDQAELQRAAYESEAHINGKNGYKAQLTAASKTLAIETKDKMVKETVSKSLDAGKKLGQAISGIAQALRFNRGGR